MEDSHPPIPLAQPKPRQAPYTAHRSASPPYHGAPPFPSSPQTRSIYSSPPRVASPAGSLIFERDVQESSSLPGPNSPAIPSHIQTENHIPPVLDASSEAITSTTIDPDTVEIFMHSSHQPAAFAMAGMGPDSMASSWQEHDVHLPSLAHPDGAETASNYGSLDTTNVRRLSFISFADVVQSEHAEQHGAGNRDSVVVAGLTTLSSPSLNRSPSPIRSPVSSHTLGTTPPTSKTASIKGVEMSPARRPPPGQLGAGLSPERSDLTVETMTQALRKTGSGDLGGGSKSRPLSPREPWSPESLEG